MDGAGSSNGPVSRLGSGAAQLRVAYWRQGMGGPGVPHLRSVGWFAGTGFAPEIIAFPATTQPQFTRGPLTLTIALVTYSLSLPWPFPFLPATFARP